MQDLEGPLERLNQQIAILGERIRGTKNIVPSQSGSTISKEEESLNLSYKEKYRERQKAIEFGKALGIGKYAPRGASLDIDAAPGIVRNNIAVAQTTRSEGLGIAGVLGGLLKIGLNILNIVSIYKLLRSFFGDGKAKPLFDALDNFFNPIIGFIDEMKAKFLKWFQETFPETYKFLEDSWNAITGWFSDIAKWFKEKWENIKTSWNDFDLKSIFSPEGGWGKFIGEFANKIFQQIDFKNVFKDIDIGEMLKNVKWSEIFGSLTDSLNKMNLEELFGKLDLGKVISVEKLGEEIKKIDFSGIFSHIVTEAQNFFKQKDPEMLASLNNVWSSIKTFLKQIEDFFNSEDKLGYLKNLFKSDDPNGFINKIITAADNIAAASGSAKNAAADVEHITNRLRGWVDGIGDLGTMIKDAIKEKLGLGGDEEGTEPPSPVTAPVTAAQVDDFLKRTEAEEKAAAESRVSEGDLRAYIKGERRSSATVRGDAADASGGIPSFNDYVIRGNKIYGFSNEDDVLGFKAGGAIDKVLGKQNEATITLTQTILQASLEQIKILRSIENNTAAANQLLATAVNTRTPSTRSAAARPTPINIFNRDVFDVETSPTYDLQQEKPIAFKGMYLNEIP